MLLLLQLCTNTCNWASDGACDDGGPRAQNAACSLGTDCVDCGSQVSTSAGLLSALANIAASHHRELQTSVSTVADLTSALANTAVGRIVLASGTYYLSAELSITRSVVLEAAAGATVTLNAQASSSSPRRVLYIAPGSSAVVQLIGLSITGGYVDLECNTGCMPACCGGGGVLIDGGTVTLSSCTITGNTFQGGEGGGVYVRSGTVTLSSCTITGNTATFVYARGQGGWGGGVSIQTSSVTSLVTLSSCTITGNSVAHYGGGVLIAGIGKVTLSSCIITGNSAYSATNTGNNPTNNGGGGVAVFTTGGTVAILSSNISGNIVAGQNSVRAHAQTFPWP